jgi:two-component system OmpR family response regulator
MSSWERVRGATLVVKKGNAWQGIAMSQLVMIIDDEAGVRDLLGDALKLAGFETITAADAMIAQTLLRNTKPDLLIVDINMPMMDGFEFIERIRGNGNNTPALMLSARADRADVTRGLTLGADDYVTKPFGLEELVLRIKAILRRSQFTLTTPTNMSCGPITLDSDSHQVTFNDERIDLSPTEFRLLHVLLESKGRVLSKTYLLDEVWGITFESESTVVDTYISYLRKKLHRDGFEGIRTVRGVGFQLQAEKK